MQELALDHWEGHVGGFVGGSLVIHLTHRITYIPNRRQMLHMVLQQVTEYLMRAQITLLERPAHRADDLLAFVAEGFAHFNQMLTV